MLRKQKGKGQTRAERQLWLATTQAGKKYWGDMVQAERAQKGSGFDLNETTARMIADGVLKASKQISNERAAWNKREDDIHRSIRQQWGFGKQKGSGILDFISEDTKARMITDGIMHAKNTLDQYQKQKGGSVKKKLAIAGATVGTTAVALTPIMLNALLLKGLHDKFKSGNW